MLVSKKAIAAVDPLSPPGSVEDLQVITGLRITVSEYRTSGGFLEHPDLGAVAVAPEIGGNASRAEVHIGGECGWRRAPRQPALFLADLGQGQPQPAKFFG